MNKGDDTGEGVSSNESGHRSNDVLGRSIRSNSSYVIRTLAATLTHSEGIKELPVRGTNTSNKATHNWVPFINGANCESAYVHKLISSGSKTNIWFNKSEIPNGKAER